MIILYINCKLFPFIDLIISGLKLFETRNRNTLKTLIGKTVYLAETGKGKATVKATCIIREPVIITDKAVYESYRNKTMIETGSEYDWKSSTKQKVLYPLENVRSVPAFPVPGNVVRHGRIYAEMI